MVVFLVVPLPLLPRRAAVHSSPALVPWSSVSWMDVRRRVARQQRVGKVRGEDGAMGTKERYGGNASPGQRGVVRLRPGLVAHQIVARAQVKGRWGAGNRRERKEGIRGPEKNLMMLRNPSSLGGCRRGSRHSRHALRVPVRLPRGVDAKLVLVVKKDEAMPFKALLLGHRALDPVGV